MVFRELRVLFIGVLTRVQQYRRVAEGFRRVGLLLAYIQASRAPTRPYGLLLAPVHAIRSPPRLLIAYKVLEWVFGALNTILTYINTYSHTDKSHNDFKHIMHDN